MYLAEAALYEGILFGALLIVGGITGYTLSGSKPSLYAGSISGIIAISLSYLGLSGRRLLALFLLATEAILLNAMFYVRYRKTSKLMPAGFMLIVSFISLILFLVGIIAA